MCTAFITNTASFYAMRGLLGITEVRLSPRAPVDVRQAAIFPGVSYMVLELVSRVAADLNELTRYYKRSEITVRVGFFMCVAGRETAR